MHGGEGRWVKVGTLSRNAWQRVPKDLRGRTGQACMKARLGPQSWWGGCIRSTTRPLVVAAWRDELASGQATLP